MPLTDDEATARAEAEVRAYCGWHIAPVQTDQLVVDGSGAHIQMLPTLRLTALGALRIDGVAVDVASIEWTESGFLRRRTRFPCTLRGVGVTITHGYDTMPLDVQAVIDRLAARNLATADASTYVQVGAVRVATGEDGLPMTGSLSEIDRWVLDRYRIPVRP